MNSEWSLDILYKGFDDPKFKEDLTSFEKKAKELDELSKTLSHENEKKDLLQIVKVLEEFELLEKHLSCFGSLSQSTNTANAKAAAAIDKTGTPPHNRTPSLFRRRSKNAGFRESAAFSSA